VGELTKHLSRRFHLSLYFTLYPLFLREIEVLRLPRDASPGSPSPYTHYTMKWSARTSFCTINVANRESSRISVFSTRGFRPLDIVSARVKPSLRNLEVAEHPYHFWIATTERLPKQVKQIITASLHQSQGRPQTPAKVSRSSSRSLSTSSHPSSCAPPPANQFAWLVSSFNTHCSHFTAASPNAPPSGSA
jgi:hypothetical protein